MEASTVDTEARARTVAALEALADERRLAIVELLAGGEKCLCDISATLGISNALASHHVKRLRAAGIVVTRRKGTWLHCRLDTGALAASARWLDGIAAEGANTRAAACCPTKEWEADE